MRPILKGAVLVLIAGIGAMGQNPPASPAASALLTNAQVAQLCTQLTQLMEAGGVAISELQRAAAPVIENVRQSCAQLQLRPGRGQATYALLMNLRAYLALADAVPKPYPFPDAAQKQFAELRDDATRLDSHFRALIEQKDSQLVTADPANLTRYADANRKVAAPNPAKRRVVFFGDSITDFWRLNEYFPESDYLNRGIAGQTTGEMLQRMKADVIDLRPDAVLILAGTNDLAREVPLVAIEANYQSMAELAEAHKIKLIFASVLPVSDYHKDQNPVFERTPARPLPYIKALNEWIQRFCAQRGCAYLDYYSSLVDTNGQLIEDGSDDGLHPNSKGYRLMGPLASAAIAKALEPRRPATPVPPANRSK